MSELRLRQIKSGNTIKGIESPIKCQCCGFEYFSFHKKVDWNCPKCEPNEARLQVDDDILYLKREEKCIEGTSNEDMFESVTYKQLGL